METFQILVTKIQGCRLACRTSSIFCCASSRALQWTEVMEAACRETQPSHLQEMHDLGSFCRVEENRGSRRCSSSSEGPPGLPREQPVWHQRAAVPKPPSAALLKAPNTQLSPRQRRQENTTTDHLIPFLYRKLGAIQQPQAAMYQTKLRCFLLLL